MVIVDEAGVTGGVDTHLEVHVAAALDPIGGLLGVESFETGRAGEDKLIAWLMSFGLVALVGVEGTGSYGAGLVGDSEQLRLRLLRLIVRTVKLVAVTARVILLMRSRQREQRRVVERWDGPRPETETSRRFGRCWSLVVVLVRLGSRL